MIGFSCSFTWMSGRLRMRDVMLIEDADQAGAVLNPLRLELLRRADEPRTCKELAEALRETPQKIYYHVKVLERAGALEKVEERRGRPGPQGKEAAPEAFRLILACYSRPEGL